MSEVTTILQPLRWVWITVYAVIVAVHLGHMSKHAARGETVWHVGHVAMCSGMISMFLPTELRLVPAEAWMAVISGLFVVIAAIGMRGLTQGASIDSVWLLSVVDMCAMLYMLVAPPSLYKFGAGILAVYFAVEMVAWFAGAFDDARRQLIVALASVGLEPRMGHGSASLLSDVNTENIRFTSGLMSAGMSYMFLMMIYGP